MSMLHDRSVAQERVAAVSQSEEAELSRKVGSASNGGWTGVQTSGGRGDNNRTAASRLEHRLDSQRGRGRAEVGGGGTAAGVESTARVRRTIQFLEDCDR